MLDSRVLCDQYLNERRKQRSASPSDEWLDRLLLHIGYQLDHHLSAPLNHPKDRWSLFLPCASATFAFASVSTSFPSRVLHDLRLPFMAGNYIRFVALHLV